MRARSLVNLHLVLSLGVPAVALPGTIVAVAAMLVPNTASAADNARERHRGRRAAPWLWHAGSGGQRRAASADPLS